jgi:hypothetical protein
MKTRVGIKSDFVNNRNLNIAPATLGELQPIS